MPLTNLFGSKSGSETIAVISPVLMSKTTTEPFWIIFSESKFSLANAMPWINDSVATFWDSIFKDKYKSFPDVGGMNSTISLPLNIISPALPDNCSS